MSQANVLHAGDAFGYDPKLDDDGSIFVTSLRDQRTTIIPIGRTRPLFSPKTARTLLSDKQLELHGLCYMIDADAQSWIIPNDADNLVDVRPSSAWIDDLCSRISDLKEISIEEELPYNEKSAQDSIDFAKSINSSVKPSAFLIGNGNIRLLWLKNNEQIGLQFLGDGLVQYVMFARREKQIAPHMGSDDTETITRQISALGLRHLLKS